MIYDNGFVGVKGATLEYQLPCNSFQELRDITLNAVCMMPGFINLALPDPPVIVGVNGKLGETSFRWQYSESSKGFLVKHQNELESDVIKMLTMQNKMSVQDARLIAAASYFHTACRLGVAGNSPWEFMSEVILNFCKCLQAVFGETMDEVRAGLRGLGVSDEKIENDIVPLMVLRSHFDVGHAMISVPDADQLQVLYRYLNFAEGIIRDVLKVVFEKHFTENIFLINKENLDPDKQPQKKFDRVIDSIKACSFSHRLRDL